MRKPLLTHDARQCGATHCDAHCKTSYYGLVDVIHQTEPGLMARNGISLRAALGMHEPQSLFILSDLL